MKTPVHQLLDIVIAASEKSRLQVTPSQYDLLHKICWKYRHECLPTSVSLEDGESVKYPEDRR